MKRILSYLLLCVYATIMIKPVMPTVTDAFAHLLNYKEHMSTVHQHNGKFHVHFEYIEAAKKDSRENSPYNNTAKKNGGADDHVMFVTMPVASGSKATSDHPDLPSQYLPVISLMATLRPPIKLAA